MTDHTLSVLTALATALAALAAVDLILDPTIKASSALGCFCHHRLRCFDSWIE